MFLDEFHSTEALKGFHGLLQCDGYQGYNKVEGVVLVCCQVHCRRKFYKALPKEWQKIKLLDILSEEAIPEPVLPKEGRFPNSPMDSGGSRPCLLQPPLLY
nr:transposase [uncultured Marvinbryantia sp.]